MEGKAFRHGDIVRIKPSIPQFALIRCFQEDVLSELAKKYGGSMAVLGGLLGKGKGGSKFTSIDIKRVYFG